jgi:hypothetical protein
VVMLVVVVSKRCVGGGDSSGDGYSSNDKGTGVAFSVGVRAGCNWVWRQC